jgi:hypothetical protein
MQTGAISTLMMEYPGTILGQGRSSSAVFRGSGIVKTTFLELLIVFAPVA